jgi:hypothetical protein
VTRFKISKRLLHDALNHFADDQTIKNIDSRDMRGNFPTYFVEILHLPTSIDLVLII